MVPPVVAALTKRGFNVDRGSDGHSALGQRSYKPEVDSIHQARISTPLAIQSSLDGCAPSDARVCDAPQVVTALCQRGYDTSRAVAAAALFAFAAMRGI
jgi:hypothetical protein